MLNAVSPKIIRLGGLGWQSMLSQPSAVAVVRVALSPFQGSSGGLPTWGSASLHPRLNYRAASRLCLDGPPLPGWAATVSERTVAYRG
jgi:hypothetical protein